jgi:hypothetical protein
MVSLLCVRMFSCCATLVHLQGQYYNGRPQLSGKVGPKSGLAYCIFSGKLQVRRVLSPCATVLHCPAANDVSRLLMRAFAATLKIRQTT